MHITLAKEANHGVSVRHDAPFKNGVGFNFNNSAIKKIAWAGHVCQVKIFPNSIHIND